MVVFSLRTSHVRAAPRPAHVRGRLVTLEGIDGSGKTTLGKALAERLGALHTREPTDGVAGRAIRGLTAEQGFDERAVLHLFLADRLQHVNNEILPALEAGKLVICDRFMHSTMAYQAHLGLGGQLRTMHRPWCPEPDMVLLLDLDVEVAAARLEGRGKKDAFEGIERQRRVRTEYLRQAVENPVAFRVLDATLKPEVLLVQAVAHVGELTA
jgi:dTMP kinase